MLLETNTLIILMKTLTVIVPFYNEERTLGELVRQLYELPLGTFNQCIFVNDGSTDGSLDLISRALVSYPIPHKIVNKLNGGKASAIKEASTLLETSHAVILDADLELSTTDLIGLWEIVQRGQSDVVFGYRNFLAQSAFTYRYARGNQFLSHLYGILFNEVITDIMCGYKLLPTKYFLACPFKYKNFAIEIEIPLLLWLERLRPYEIPVDYKPRSREAGKVIGVSDALQIIFDLVYFRITKGKKRIK
jgi:glycosyltransferase involved in cell wall biosynthesis